MGVIFSVQERAGDFRMADFYEQVNSYLDAANGKMFTIDGMLLASTIYAGPSGFGVWFGGVDLSSPGYFTPVAVLEDPDHPDDTIRNTLMAALDAGQSGTQAMATVFAGDDSVFGFRHNDELWGFAGNDRMIGMAGNDILHGGAGDDHLQGDRGKDVLEGGSGRDRFDYADIVRGTAGGWGQDTILDFRQGQDKIEFNDTIGIRRFSDLTITDKQGDAVISDAAGDTITLKGIAAASLTAKDFAFLKPSEVPLDHHAGVHVHGALDWTNPHLALA